jgi:phage tail sheath protein FI
MISDRAPGVYVVEVPSGARPIEAVSTVTAAFVGIAPDARVRIDEPVPIQNWTEFRKQFMPEGSTPTHLAYAVHGFLANGGTRGYVLNLGPNGSLAGDGAKRQGLAALERVDEIAIVAAPGFTQAADYEALLGHCERLGDRFAVLDLPERVEALDRLVEVATAGETPRRRGAATAPEGEGAGAATGETRPVPAAGLRPRTSDRGFGAAYFPWVVVRDLADPRQRLAVPPSGHVAGIYARSDTTHGVHKAPANEPVREALDLVYRVTRDEQANLNRAGINCIRYFPRDGIRVWGARTLASASSEWKYLNVRRLFNMIEESILQSTRWVVFEPNDATLWKSIRRDVSAFLLQLWRNRALLGNTPEEAFFVRCDSETNPPESIDQGLVVIEIGIAPVKPAEFVVFRIGQQASGATVEAP